MSETVFSTERLVVRRWRTSDIDAVFAVYGDVQAMRWVDDGEPITREACERWMSVTQANYARRGYGMFAVEQKSVPGVIGFCGLVHPGDQAEPEVKYAYLRAHWGQGVATEVLRGLIHYGADVHGLDFIIATTAPENTASHRVLLKAGLERGLLRKDGDGSCTQLFHWSSGAKLPTTDGKTV